MSRFNLFQWLRVISLQYPLWTFTAVYALGVAVYVALLQTTWGREIANVVGSMVSTEFGALQMKLQQKSLGDTAIRLLQADALNCVLDLVLAKLLLRWELTHLMIQGIDERIQALKTEWRNNISRIVPTNGIGNSKGFLSRLSGHLKHLILNPKNGSAKTVFWLALLPRIPFLPGGVAVGIVIINYNHLRFRGWLMLTIGVMIRHVVTLFVLFGVGSLF